MKKIFTLVFCLIIAGGALSCTKKSGDDKSLADIKAKGFFIVGLDDEFPPMGFRGKDSEITGFDIDLAKETAKEMGVDVKFKPVDWDGVIFSLTKGDIDVIWNGLTITKERKERIAFTKPYLDNRQIIIVQKKSSIKNKKDLAGKIAGLQLGSSAEKALNRDKETAKSLKDVKKYSNNPLALMDLASGRIEAVVVDEIVGRYYIAKKPGVYKVIADDFGREEYGVGLRKKDVSFKKELDRALDAVKTSKAGVKISKKWFGENILKN